MQLLPHWEVTEKLHEWCERGTAQTLAYCYGYDMREGWMLNNSEWMLIEELSSREEKRTGQ